MEEIRALDKKFKVYFKLNEANIFEYTKCVKRENPVDLALKNATIISININMELIIINAYKKTLELRLRMDEISQHGIVPRNEVETLFHYENFLKAKKSEYTYLIEYSISKFFNVDPIILKRFIKLN